MYTFVSLTHFHRFPGVLNFFSFLQKTKSGLSFLTDKVGLCRPMGSNANRGKKCVGIGKTWISHFDPRALLVFVLHGQKKKTTEDTRVENGGGQ